VQVLFYFILLQIGELLYLCRTHFSYVAHTLLLVEHHQYEQSICLSVTHVGCRGTRLGGTVN